MLINFFKKKNQDSGVNKNLIHICALFVHAAKMDENYTDKEKSIIIKALSNISDNKEINFQNILEEAEKKENESNQILEFTKEIKKMDKEFRLKIIEVLMKIIYSDDILDMYESTLMRRLGGLLYISDKEIGEIKKIIIGNKAP
tara:strand:- start:689 stop:1120 length:432 start_codon:yes stop_codon:yes gene_type:complete